MLSLAAWLLLAALAAAAGAALLAVAGAAATPLTKTQYMTLAPKFFGLQRNYHSSTPKASLRTFSTSFSIKISRRIFLDRSQGLKCSKYELFSEQLHAAFDSQVAKNARPGSAGD